MTLTRIMGDVVRNESRGHRLPRGLGLLYSRDGSTCDAILSLSRKEIEPSDQEVDIVIGALREAEGAFNYTINNPVFENGHYIIRVEIDWCNDD